MAIKNNRLQDAAPDAASLEDIETLRARYGVSRPVFVGVCSANGWRRGRKMAAGVFLAAAAGFAMHANRRLFSRDTMKGM